MSYFPSCIQFHHYQLHFPEKLCFKNTYLLSKWITFVIESYSFPTYAYNLAVDPIICKKVQRGSNSYQHVSYRNEHHIPFSRVVLWINYHTHCLAHTDLLNYLVCHPSLDFMYIWNYSCSMANSKEQNSINSSQTQIKIILSL